MDILLTLKSGVDIGEALQRWNLQSTALAQSLSRLSKGATEDDLCRSIVEQDGQEFLPHLFFILSQWKHQGLIDYSVTLDQKVLAKVVPDNGYFEFSRDTLDFNRSYQLSRFACLRRDGLEMVLECAFVPVRVVLKDVNGAAVFACLAKPGTSSEAVTRIASVSAEEVNAWLQLLAGLRIVKPADEPEPDALATWEFHDALFHGSTRSESFTRNTGATSRFRDKIPALPALKPAMSSQIVELKRPAIRNDPSFTDVLERRRSLRECPTEPMSLDLLSEFLYRVASIREPLEHRRYPAAGGIHELEFYVTVNSCDGLRKGLYHYNGTSHTLQRLASNEKQIQHLLDDAARSWGQTYLPQILIILSSRFGRIAWEYERIAYRSTLLNAGVVIQTMYLVATAMGLAPCALGWGDSDLFARAAGLDPLAESSVAEFALSRAQ